MGIFDSIKKLSEQTENETSLTGSPCPACGGDEYGSDSMLSSELKCLNCGETYSNEEIELKRLSFGSGVSQDDSDLAQELVSNAEHRSVSVDKLTKSEGYLGRYGTGNNLLSLLDDGEQPHYIFQGNSVDIEGGGDSSSIFGNNRSRKMSTGASDVTTLVTNRRVIVYVPQLTGNDQRNVPYDSITGVDMDSGLINKRLTIQTHGRTYHMSGFNSGQETVRKAMEYIRRTRSQWNQQSQTTQSTEDSEDPFDQLERLRDLKNDGVISQEEFNEKKTEILDRI